MTPPLAWSSPPAGSACEPHGDPLAHPMPCRRHPRDAFAMVTPSHPVLVQTTRRELQALLAKEQDPHRRQRALVRASLVACPGRGRTPRPLAY